MTSAAVLPPISRRLGRLPSRTAREVRFGAQFDTSIPLMLPVSYGTGDTHVASEVECVISLEQPRGQVLYDSRSI